MRGYVISIYCNARESREVREKVSIEEKSREGDGVGSFWEGCWTDCKYLLYSIMSLQLQQVLALNDI